LFVDGCTTNNEANGKHVQFKIYVPNYAYVEGQNLTLVGQNSETEETSVKLRRSLVNDFNTVYRDTVLSFTKIRCLSNDVTVIDDDLGPFAHNGLPDALTCEVIVNTNLSGTNTILDFNVPTVPLLINIPEPFAETTLYITSNPGSEFISLENLDLKSEATLIS
jgi:hypothetical protein